jgi:hypothetical protein
MAIFQLEEENKLGKKSEQVTQSLPTKSKQTNYK